MTTRCAAAIVALVVGCGATRAPGQAPTLDVETIRASIRKALAERAAPSMAVAVAQSGRIAWSEGFGFADREAGVAATAETPYSIASLTKPFTATALMMLAERRLIDLDAPLTRYLGPLDRPGVADPDAATVRRVLGHVAGFPVHYQYFFDDRPERPLPFAETMRCYGAEIQPPGTRYTYSNIGFGALGEMVARVSGQKYGDFLAREVFAPLGLKRASVPERAEDAASAARRYGRDGVLLPFYVTDFPGGSAVYASVEDVARFGSFHAGALMDGQRAILTETSRAAMQQKGLGDYGLGWSINSSWNGHQVVWHSGAMPGSSATLWLVPERRIAIAVVANQIGAPVNQLAGQILGQLLPGGQSAPAPAENAPRAQVRSLIAAGEGGHRFRGRLLSCPAPEPLHMDARQANAIKVALGSGSPTSLEGRLTSDGLSGSFSPSTGPRASGFRVDLRLNGNRLRGPVTRRTSLGPRANVLVTLWAELEREQ
jgi:CubicO group peptidase (beta-lactamase class C family)